MDGATGTALEWALALQHAPAERYRLRQRPLPPGIAELLAIAANVAPEELDAAAARLRESSETLREAARFYAREVLFHADADAYRILGVEADAPIEQIKAHYRLLQIWLHPDRQQSGDDSVFAARVNTAWNQLRSGDRRRDYDAARSDAVGSDDHRQFRTASVANMPSGGGRVWPSAAPTDSPILVRKRHRALVVGLLGVCLLLGWLAVRQSEQEPEPWTFNETEAAASPPAPAATVRSEVRPAALPARSLASRSSSRTPAPATVGIDARMARPAPVPEPEFAPTPVQRLAVEPAATSSRSSVPVPMTVPPASRSVAASARVPSPRPPRSSPPVATRTTPPTSAAVAATPRVPPSVPARAAAPASDSIAASDGHSGAASEIDRTPPLPAASSGTAGEATLFGRLRQAFSRHSGARAAPELGVDGDVGFERIQQARQVGNQLLQYLASKNRTPPPIWSSAATLDRADGVRRDMHRGGATRLDSPQWRIGKTAASLRSDYRVAGITRGTLSAAVVWREGRWLVTSIDLEEAP